MFAKFVGWSENSDLIARRSHESLVTQLLKSQKRVLQKKSPSDAWK